MATILYLHGFASIGNNPKSEALREAFEGLGHTVLAPDLPVDPTEVRNKLDRIIRKAEFLSGFPIVMVGTSLGGFWANLMAQIWHEPCVLVNPSVKPSETMEPRVGEELFNYATGEPVEVTRLDIKKFKRCEDLAAKLENSKRTTVFLAKDDEVLDWHEAAAYFAADSVKIIKEDGGHRFEKHWPEVIKKIEEIIAK